MGLTTPETDGLHESFFPDRLRRELDNLVAATNTDAVLRALELLPNLTPEHDSEEVELFLERLHVDGKLLAVLLGVPPRFVRLLVFLHRRFKAIEDESPIPVKLLEFG